MFSILIVFDGMKAESLWRKCSLTHILKACKGKIRNAFNIRNPIQKQKLKYANITEYHILWIQGTAGKIYGKLVCTKEISYLRVTLETT